MRERETEMVFHSPLGELMVTFLREKQACGYRYAIGLHALRRLDNFLCEQGLSTITLPSPMRQDSCHLIEVVSCEVDNGENR